MTPAAKAAGPPDPLAAEALRRWLPRLGHCPLPLAASAGLCYLDGKEENDMAHSLPEILNDALQLSPEDRARLAVRLITSLEETVESAEEIEKLWIAEAERRFQELRAGAVQGIPAGEVFAELRTKRS